MKDKSRSLAGRLGGWAGFFNGQRADPRAVDRLVVSGDPDDLPWLLPRALSSTRETAEDAAAGIRRHLVGLSPRQLAEVDEQVRHLFQWIGFTDGGAWDDTLPAQVPRLAPLGAETLGLASFHTNGHVREAAVRELAAIRDGSELPYLLIRQNDWVLPVRRRAYDAVRERLTAEYAPHLVRDLWLVLRLAWCGREDHSPFLEQTRALLTGPGRAALAGGLDSPDRWIRRACHRMLLDPPAADAEEIVARALRDDDNVVLLRGLRWAEEVFPETRLREALSTLVRHPFVIVRREALAMWVRRFPETAGPELRRGLFDPNATIRAIARHALAPEEFRALYRATLCGASGSLLRAALHGLGETGSEEDAKAVVPYLSADAAEVRKAAVTAYARLADPVPAIPLLASALGDANASISKTARLALAPHASLVGAETLWRLVRHGEAHVRANALPLIAALGKWESIGWLVRAQAEDDPATARLADGLVRRWLDRFNRSGARPSKEQVERATRAIDDAAPALGKERVRMLRFLMKGYR